MRPRPSLGARASSNGSASGPTATIKYAENPPKKYQDIVNVDFYNPDREGLWNELRDTVLFWVGEGVRTFRVDNPHTKPLPFWEWLIREVKARLPGGDLSVRGFHPAEDDASTCQGRGSPSPIPISPGGTPRPS